MKILYAYDKMPTTYQAYLLQLLEVLKRDVDVEVLSYNSDANVEHTVTSSDLSFRLHRLAYRAKLSKFPYLDIKIMSEYDIVHLQHSYLFPKIEPFINSNIKRPKIVITLRGGDTYIRPWLYKNWEFFFKSQSHCIDAFITVSEHQKNYLQRWGVPEYKIHVIPVSIGPKTFALPKYPSQGTIKIVSAHRMCWEKNIEGNLRTIKILKERGMEIHYDIFGDGRDKDQLYFLVDKYDLGKEVNIFGKIENRAFKNRLAKYDIFLQLSHSEAFGASVIEAQSMGVPAIISNAGGLPETILENVSGYCVDSYRPEQAAEHIIDLVTNKEKFLSFSKAAIEHSNANFTTAQEAKRLINLYKSL
ncbi:glycosyltransferase family 4 protein [Aegicerativicinus sediminis]|uniref:glycosyltransferase family 4 protein n=1 Tax=Aegicerativicinus sediminis TaxID=2893202 RepID=UPI001E475C9C|nr:glycosyltransferase family 4 protein [Aegicerativicinus sediminis]